MNIEVAFNEFPALQSENLILKKIEASNIEELYTIYSNEKVFKYCGIIPKKNIKTISNMVTHFERDFNKKDRIKWGIFLKNKDDILVGIIEAMDFKPKIDMVTIGYFLSESYWGNGIASEALKTIIKFLFEKVNVNRIQAEVMPENEVSKKVLLKNGFTKEGLLRQANLWSGKGIVDLEIYSILKGDYN
ncbi:MAG: GNAT family N-acetyltransferase [Clostridium argentinense]|uniref:GNAT family N-acetyltransferase n=1 Tax=Clostridium faecium TaxID=2762223 RepID=A0ABR8YVI6_9CLOT|nr:MULTISPECIES: GNAT family protein [Clostridium]MBD8048287.1 GNAT family N-acetyltransferase [Clostridium faecium]MBS5823050.1 GNAT family N-acetyltransferase [Clostridium argentinense]MDU1349210.1 GNAT family protein [Clostridium argentinense]